MAIAQLKSEALIQSRVAASFSQFSKHIPKPFHHFNTCIGLLLCCKYTYTYVYLSSLPLPPVSHPLILPSALPPSSLTLITLLTHPFITLPSHPPLLLLLLLFLPRSAKVRRLYDIANVLTTLELIKKKTFLAPNHRKMPGYVWCGPSMAEIDTVCESLSLPPSLTHTQTLTHSHSLCHREEESRRGKDCIYL